MAYTVNLNPGQTVIFDTGGKIANDNLIVKVNNKTNYYVHTITFNYKYSSSGWAIGVRLIIPSSTVITSIEGLRSAIATYYPDATGLNEAVVAAGGEQQTSWSSSYFSRVIGLYSYNNKLYASYMTGNSGGSISYNADNLTSSASYYEDYFKDVVYKLTS